MTIEELKKMTLKDIVNIDASKLTTEEVAYIEKRLVQASNRRVKRLKESGKIGLTKLSKKEKRGFTPYKVPKGYTAKTGTKGVYMPKEKKKGKKKSINVRNKRVKNISEMQEFLKKKTSTVTGVDTQMNRYKDVIRKTTGYEGNITDRQAKRVSKLMEKAKEMGITNDANKKLSGSPRLLSLILDIVKQRKYVRNDEAELIIQKAIEEGYESAQETLSKLRNEDKIGLDIDDNEEESDEIDYEDYFNIF